MTPLASVITYCGEPALVVCDRRCDKAWGIISRPRWASPEDEGDCVWCADGEFETAPYPMESEGESIKPVRPPEAHNKWCVRACERCSMTERGEVRRFVAQFATGGSRVSLAAPDWSRRVANMPGKHTQEEMDALTIEIPPESRRVNLGQQAAPADNADEIRRGAAALRGLIDGEGE